ncbi:ABC transporter permease [Arsenophonus nasoniae]|uniref:ABC transporter permease n=1 Tax=Arsenophonus nasoniae TaxID=638 RepID=UPI0038793670
MLHRLYTLIIKELQSLLQEPQTRAILILPVIFQMILFPLAATLDVTNTTIAIFNEDKGQDSIELTQRLAKSTTFAKGLRLNNHQQVAETINNRKALLVIHFPQNFSAQLAQRKSTPVQLILDGRNSNSAQIAANTVTQVIENYQQRLSNPQMAKNNSELIIRNWYNSNLDYKWFIVPSLVALITTIDVLVVTSLSIAREREQGTLDQLLVSPLTTWQIFIGKAVPALLIATFQATLVLIIGIFCYKIPFSGSLLVFYSTMTIYGLSLVGFGLLISAMCSTQQQAFIGVFVFMMPAVLLSGYVSPIENMPIWLQNFTWINPIRHFTDITKQIYLKNADFAVLWHNLWPLIIISLCTTTLAYWLFSRKIA